jgi:hypothetical protein
MKIKGMRINWKVLLALALIVGAGYWVVNSMIPRSYSGTALNLEIGSGTVTVTNPSGEPVPGQLVGVSRNARVSSTIEGLSGSPIREGVGNSATYLFEFLLPPGDTEFWVTRSPNTNFVMTSEIPLEVSVQLVSLSSARTVVVVAAVVALGSLFYISHSMEHRWIAILRRQETAVVVLKPATESVAAGGQGRVFRAPGDNRAKNKD